MRFFKYLVLTFLSIISLNASAALQYRYNGPYLYTNWSTHESACSQIIGQKLANDNIITQSSPVTVNSQATCYIVYQSSTNPNNGGSGNYTPLLSQTVLSCPSQDEMAGMQVTYFDYGTPVPTRTCTKLESGKYCVYESKTEDPLITNGVQRQMVVLWSISITPSLSCTPSYKGVCNKNDPYGGCYTPPNDGCTRQINGSIVCPPEAPPPQPEPTCGGATYCVRPPEGCGTGYVSGSFNGQQLCVKSGPSTPPDPTDPTDPQPPNQCTAQYCPKPEPEKECPTGYYSSYYNGTPLCVANNPNPNQPNQNDPNNNENASSEPIGGDDPNTSFDVKGIIDAIKALRDSLLGSIENVSKKLTTLIDGQKTTNDHLNKLNEKSQTANEHLQNIEDSSLATSEAVGDTNKKLDQIFSDQGKQQIEQLGEQSTDSRLTAAESEMTSKLQTFANTLSYSSSHVCISDFTVTDIPHFGSMTVPLSKWCDLLALVKLLLKLAVLMLALRMIHLTVRVF